MAWDAIKDDIREEGRIGEKKEMILDFLSDLGEVPEALKDSIMSETRTDLLKSMVKIASKAASFSDFEEKISKL